MLDQALSLYLSFFSGFGLGENRSTDRLHFKGYSVSPERRLSILDATLGEKDETPQLYSQSVKTEARVSQSSGFPRQVPRWRATRFSNERPFERKYDV
jgi:hypothetical protein